MDVKGTRAVFDRNWSASKNEHDEIKQTVRSQNAEASLLTKNNEHLSACHSYKQYIGT